MTAKKAPREERVVWLPLGEMHPFKGYSALRGIMPGNQPYHVRDDDPSMQQIAATVKERGVRQPSIVRPTRRAAMRSSPGSAATTPANWRAWRICPSSSVR